MCTRAFTILFVFVALVSCNSSNSDREALLDRAFLKQKEVVDLMSDLEKGLRASDHKEKDSLLQVIDRLEENLFAIPGFDLELEGHGDHNHDHANIALSAEEIYGVQEELLNELNQIQIILRKP